MQSLEAACEEGERSVKRVKPNRPFLPLRPQDPSSASTSKDITENPSGKPPFDIFAKLLELYEEENEEEEESEDIPNLKFNPLLLEKLVARERLNTLIVNLYPGNKGYSLAFRLLPIGDPNYTDADTANMIETDQWPYEEDSLLRCIDNEELPPSIIDLIENEFSYLFYNGCIIAEVRDYRQAYPHFKCDIHHVLLKPTQRSIMADINNMSEDKTEWGPEERDQLESHLLMANEPGLCLEPDASLADQLQAVHNRKFLWNTHRYRRMARKFSQVTVNRKRKLDQFTHRPGLELYEFLCRSQSKPKMGAPLLPPKRPAADDARPTPVPVPNLEPPPTLAPPSDPISIAGFKTYQRPKETSDCLPQLIEEYVLETDMPPAKGSSGGGAQARVYHIKLSILQRPSNSEYLGELYLDRDHRKGEQNGVACRFSLGSRANANRYIHQFTEIFTESGRKSVRIRYSLSPGYKERVAIAQAQPQNGSAAVEQPQQHLQQLSHSLLAPAVNGAGVGVGAVQGQPQGASSVPILKSHLQGTSQVKQATQNISKQELEISALAIKLENSAQQFQAAANAKQQQQHQKIPSSNPALINILNSSPAAPINSDAVSSAITNAAQPPQAAQKLVARKMLLPSGARVLTQGGKSAALSALLVGTPAADRPDIVGPNTGSLLLEKLGGVGGPPQQGGQAQAGGAISVQSLNFAQLQSIPGLQNLQVQLQGYAQPISLSLNVSSTGSIQGHPTSLLVSLPATTATHTAHSAVAGGKPQTVVLTNAKASSLSQLVSSGAKAASQQAGGRTASTSQTVSLTQGGQQFQLITPLQRPRGQQVQQPSGAQPTTLKTRTLQGTPITIKMAAPNANASQVNLPSSSAIASQLQKQVQLQQYQQICLNHPSLLGSIRRRSNTSDPQ